MIASNSLRSRVAGALATAARPLASTLLAAVLVAAGGPTLALDGAPASGSSASNATSAAVVEQEPAGRGAAAQETAREEAGDDAQESGPEVTRRLAGADDAALLGPPQRRYALVGATVHSMVPGVEPAVMTVLVNGDRIDAIGVDLELPLGTERIDVSGKHLVPGLVDGLVTYDPQHDELYVTSGVTTVRDTGGNPSVRAQLKQPQFRDRVPGPFLVTAGAVLDGSPPVSPTAVILRSEGDVDNFLMLLANIEMDYACVMPNLDPTLLVPLCAKARELDMDVWGMLLRGASLDECIAAGQRGFFGLEAFLPFVESTEDPFDRIGWDGLKAFGFPLLSEKFAESGAAVVPVMIETGRLLREVDTSAPEYDYLDFYYSALWLDDAALRTELLADEDVGPKYRERATAQHEKRGALLAALAEAGAEIVPGSSAPNPWIMPGWGLHDELAYFVEFGVAPYEALRMATVGAAGALRLEDRGAIAMGKIADLLVVDGDPRESLASLRRPEQVVVRGRRLVREDLDALLERLAGRLALARTENDRPLEIDAPERPEGAAVVLAGRATSSEYGQRYQGERFEVTRLEDGRVHVASRLLQPSRGQFPERQFEFSQVLDGGWLDSFEIRVTMVLEDEEPDIVGPVEAAAPSGTQTLVVRGLWTGTRFNVERVLNGQSLGTRTIAQRPVAATLDPVHDTITCPLVLGQYPKDGEAVGIIFGEMMEPVLWRWLIRNNPDGTRSIASESGVFHVRYDERGVPVRSLYVSSGSRALLDVVEGSVRDFGGAGLPVRFETPAAEVPAEGDVPATEEGSGEGGSGEGGAESGGTGEKSDG
ncbi:amidohydrolase family protein [Rohdeia mirabilis]